MTNTAIPVETLLPCAQGGYGAKEPPVRSRSLSREPLGRGAMYLCRVSPLLYHIFLLRMPVPPERCPYALQMCLKDYIIVYFFHEIAYVGGKSCGELTYKPRIHSCFLSYIGMWGRVLVRPMPVGTLTIHKMDPHTRSLPSPLEGPSSPATTTAATSSTPAPGGRDGSSAASSSCGINDHRQVGQVAFFSSHASTHSEWKKWRHGSRLITSLSANSQRHTLQTSPSPFPSWSPPRMALLLPASKPSLLSTSRVQSCWPFLIIS